MSIMIKYKYELENIIKNQGNIVFSDFRKTPQSRNALSMSSSRSFKLKLQPWERKWKENKFPAEKRKTFKIKQTSTWSRSLHLFSDCDSALQSIQFSYACNCSYYVDEIVVSPLFTFNFYSPHIHK